MDLSSIINSPGLWIASGIMVLVVVGQSIIFLRRAVKHAPEVGLSREQVKGGMRSSIITAIGPSFAPVIVLVSLIAVLGAPTTWMRMSDVGAGRTELGMATIAAGAVGEELTAGAITTQGFTAAIWGMALNNLGWLLIVLLLGRSLGKIMTKMNEKFDPKWIKLLTLGASLGLFGYLTANTFVQKASPNLVAVIVSGALMIVFNKFLAKKRGLREFSMGICMLAGMIVATVYANIIA